MNKPMFELEERVYYESDNSNELFVGSSQVKDINYISDNGYTYGDYSHYEYLLSDDYTYYNESELYKEPEPVIRLALNKVEAIIRFHESQAKQYNSIKSKLEEMKNGSKD